MAMRKIDVSQYDHFRFTDCAHALQNTMPQLYRAGDYIGYIKSVCLDGLFSWCNFLFSMHDNRIPACWEFPENGSTHAFQSFKKLGLAEKIPDFNKSHLNFYKMLTPDFERIVSILSEHYSRWRALVKKVDLIKILKSKYKMDKETLGGDSRIYELYFIYENQYLHQQFDRFISAVDFHDWWEKEALEILKPSDDVHPVSLLESIITIVQEHEGILQSEVYEKYEDPKEDISSVIYFATKKGKIIRKKDGRSYRLYLPEQLKKAEAE